MLVISEPQCNIFLCFSRLCQLVSLNLGNNAIWPRVEFHDLIFPPRSSGAEYHLRWSGNMTKDFYSVVMCKESAILFCAREGRISAVAPVCIKVGCRERKNTTSYIVEIKPGVSLLPM